MCKLILSYALVLGACLPSAVFAQPQGPPYLFSAGAFSTDQEGNLNLRIMFNGHPERANVAWQETPNGVDLYRRLVGIECGAFERISPAPFAWVWDRENSYYNPMNIDYVDTTTFAGTAYEYMIRAVDSERNPIPTNPDVLVGYATNGDALIGHGTIVTFNLCGYPLDGYVHESCPQQCLPFIEMGRPAVVFLDLT